MARRPREKGPGIRLCELGPSSSFLYRNAANTGLTVLHLFRLSVLKVGGPEKVKSLEEGQAFRVVFCVLVNSLRLRRLVVFVKTDSQGSQKLRTSPRSRGSE